MPRFGRSFIGRQDLPGAAGFEQPVPRAPILTGTASGVFALTGAATATSFLPATGSGSFSFAGTAAGTVSLVPGSGSGSFSFAGTAAGTVAAPPAPTVTETPLASEPIIISSEQYTLRHIGPKSQVWPQSPSPPVSLLNRSDIVARPLQSENVPYSREFISGSWTGQLGDAGEFTIVFPNTDAPDGLPWRNRFDPGVNGQRNQWIEISQNGYVEFVGCVFGVEIDEQQVTVTGYDGAYLLKNAYERDWICTMAPRDVFERATQLWVPVVADNFPGSSTISGGVLTTPYNTWTLSTASGGTIAVGPSGGLQLAVSASSGATASISEAVTVPSTTNVWGASMGFTYPGAASWQATVQEDNTTYAIYMQQGTAFFYVNGVLYTQAAIPDAVTYDFLLESDGEWVWAFINGRMIGCVRRAHPSTGSLAVSFDLLYDGVGAASTTLSNVLLRALQPFLQRGTDKGDYVLPGDASTYPNGGLYARYFNDNDLQSDPYAILKVLAPTRTNAYLGSGGPEYIDQQDPTINGQNPPGFAQSSPGPGSSALAWWSCVWFGAVYLKLSQGNYTITTVQYASGHPTALRVWIGKTKLGDQIIDNWAYATPGTTSVTLSAGSLAGTLPYGGGTVQRDGWYPIRVEFAVAGTAANAPQLKFTPPITYTDPGGTTLTGGTSVVIPATSLSPLGMIDQRFQGAAHFDIAQTTVLQAVGYQASVEPKQLESGQFPGTFAPRIREGHDTDQIWENDSGPKLDPVENPANTLDATDCATSILGNGAGINNGNQGQLQAEVFDPATLAGSLFDVQAWQDFSDAAFTPLLAALLNTDLGLSLAPWQTIAATPIGKERVAGEWPVTFPATLAQARWRPGDGLRVQDRQINVQDTTPRQLLSVTRSFVPNGTTAVQATLASGPVSGTSYATYTPSKARTPAKTLKKALYQVSRLGRNYQKQLVTLSGAYVGPVSIAGGATGPSSILQLNPGDKVVNAWLRVANNSSAVPFRVLINGVDVTNTLNGPWTNVPVTLPMLPVLAINSNQNFYAQILNNSSGTASTFNYQLFVDVMR